MSGNHTGFWNRRPAGAALVIVLWLMLLLVMLLVIFLQSGTGIRQGGHLLAERERSWQLAQLAVDRVRNLLADATTGGTGSVADEVWVSQPGMVRVYNQAGELDRALKLYSSTGERVSDAEELAASVTGDVPSNWAARPREYVDINAPSSGNEYPILAPGTEAQAEGVALPDGVTMPVRWWYVKKDGSFSPDADGEVVGRVAWWTDDETAKLNVNTATEGSWYSPPFNEREIRDMPREGTAPSVPYAPTTHEYNTMPGHPAATSLSVAMRSGVFPASYTDKQVARWLIEGSPHVRFGGTEGMTRNSMQRYDTRFFPGFVPSEMGLSSFYPSIDDYFQANRERGGFLTPEGLPEIIGKARFVLTARSAGANLNPFGKPRVTLWPLPEQAAQRTAFDEKVRLASTYAGKEYFFIRRNPTSQTAANGGALSGNADFNLSRNRELLDTYLIGETAGAGANRRAIPGYPGSDHFGNKYGTADWRYTLMGIFDFIRMTNLMDASRSGLPGATAVIPGSSGGAYNNGAVTYTHNDQTDPGRNMGGDKPERVGLVVPTYVNISRQGFGRHPVITESAIHLFKISEDATTVQIGIAFYFELATPVIGYPAMYPVTTLRKRGGNFAIHLKVGPEGETDSALHDERTVAFDGVGDLTSFPVNGKGWKHILRIGGIHGMAHFLSPEENFYWSGGAGEPTGTRAESYAWYRSVSFPRDRWNQDPQPVMKMEAFTAALNLLVGGQTVQEYTFDFPATAFPLPDGPARSFARRLVESETATTYNDEDGKFENYQPSPQVTRPLDVVRSLELRDGDLRVLAFGRQISASQFVPHAGYHDTGRRQGHNLRAHAWKQYAFSAAETVQGRWFPDLVQAPPARVHGSIDNLWALRGTYDFPSSFANGFPEGRWARDLTSGPLFNIRADEAGVVQDGPWIIKANEISVAQSFKSAHVPVMVREYFTPYLQVPSPVALGTLPTGVDTSLRATTRAASRPWQTLLFAPNPIGPADGTPHPGLVAPKDHLLLNFFQMPVVDPYLLTTPGSSYGQVNLNQQVIPFTSITRTTGLHGLLKGMEMHAIADGQVGSTSFDYKTSGNANAKIRMPVDREETVKEFVKRYALDGGLNVYRYPSEVCEVFMVPKVPPGHPFFPTQPTADTIESWWAGYRITGDNLRELPYGYLYPRVTTQSNSYRVHIIAQSLSPAFSRNPDSPDGGEKYVTGQWRGSMKLERFLDSDKVADAGIGLNPDRQSLLPCFSLRVLETRVFR